MHKKTAKAQDLKPGQVVGIGIGDKTRAVIEKVTLLDDRRVALLYYYWMNGKKYYIHFEDGRDTLYPLRWRFSPWLVAFIIIFMIAAATLLLASGVIRF